MTLEIPPESFSQISDRFSMSQFFTKVYTQISKKPSLKAVVVLSNISPKSLGRLVKMRDDLRDFTISIEDLDNDLFRIYLSREFKHGIYKGILLLDVSQTGSWVIFTNGNTYYVNHIVESFLDKLYPHISRIYFNLNQMRDFIDRIKEEYKGRSTFTSLILNRKKKLWKISDPSTTKKGTLMLFEHDADEELEKNIINYNITIKRLNFNIRDENNLLLLRSNVSRKGKCSLYYGDFNGFYYNVVIKLVEYAGEWRQFYSERERSIINEDILINPFKIVYNETINIIDINRLAKKLSNVYSCAVIHSGNPYFVANVSDYDEGSSFGLTALRSTVTITPITRGTPEAIWKLTEVIQQVLGDGKIIDIQYVMS